MWTYTVSKDEKTGLWYAHKKGFPNIPVWDSFSKTKKKGAEGGG